MTDDDDENVLVGIPVARAVGPVIRGSQLHECDDCRRFIWIGPVEAALAHSDYYAAIICVDCMLAREAPL